jgi:Dolichyl-phosphate-mannose-protein mannosyltransferase
MRMPMTAAGEVVPGGQPGPRAGRLARLRQQARQVPALTRQHWLFAVLLTAGLVLRILTQLAYRPALLYIDSTKYLLNAYPGDDPPGYQLVLKPVLVLGSLDLVAVLQHLLGLGMAVGIYLLLLRRGVPRWLAALATAPVLLDAYQLQIEQNVMPDVMFEALIVAALVALLWRASPSRWLIVVAGLALGTSATARQIGEIFILPALGYLLIVTPGWRLRLKQAGLLCLAFVLPILAASYRNYADPQLHSFSLAPYASGSIYGRMAEAANCATLRLPSYERPLCPDATQKLLLGPDGLDHNIKSPIKGLWIPRLSTADYQTLKQLCPKPEQVTLGGQVQYRVVASMCGQVTSDFDRRVVKQQPLNVLASIGKDTLKMFALGRVTSSGDPSITRWQFQTYYPQYPPYIVISHRAFVFGTFNRYGVEEQIGTGSDFRGGSPAVIKPLASFLRGYQSHGGYTPGPLFAFTVLAGLAGSLAALRRRASPTQRAAAALVPPPRSAPAPALACLLFFATGVLALLSSDVFEFNWRYQLPALVTLPPAAALAVTLLLRRRSPVAAGGEVIPDPLETGHRRHDDQAERHQDHQRHPGAGLLQQDARGDRANDEGGQDAQAAGHPVRLAAGHQPGDEGREGAGQIGG